MSEFWRDRAAFVTGATGFVGSNLVRGLLDRGARVICLERDSVNPDPLVLFGLRERVTVVRGSVEDVDTLERALNEYEVDAVFHLAAQSLVGVANRSPLSTFETNIRGTYMVLEACRRFGKVGRAVVASSDKAYGTHGQLPYKEDLPMDGVFPYDVSKSCADLLARSFARTYAVPVCISRSANIYGQGDLNLSRIIPGTIMSALRNEDPIVRSDGTPVREFIHVDDVVDGYLTLAENIQGIMGEAFNFGTAEPVQMLDLVNRIIDATGGGGRIAPKVMLDRKIEREIDEQYLSGDKMMEAFGWKPKIPLDEGLKRTIDWYREYLDKLA
jgi:CDP-glucose 4,6-dehydratase